mmetsp:Transcript_58256/g.180977  ORF Transcript_58256/g.180977 Transcript_58256/m.180977 type:complete len:209 (+) Transcript_58256:212-838(+)
MLPPGCPSPAGGACHAHACVHAYMHAHVQATQSSPWCSKRKAHASTAPKVPPLSRTWVSRATNASGKVPLTLRTREFPSSWNLSAMLRMAGPSRSLSSKRPSSPSMASAFTRHSLPISCFAIRLPPSPRLSSSSPLYSSSTPSCISSLSCNSARDTSSSAAASAARARPPPCEAACSAAAARSSGQAVGRIALGCGGGRRGRGLLGGP